MDLCGIRESQGRGQRATDLGAEEAVAGWLFVVIGAMIVW